MLLPTGTKEAVRSRWQGPYQVIKKITYKCLQTAAIVEAENYVFKLLKNTTVITGNFGGCLNVEILQILPNI